MLHVIKLNRGIMCNFAASLVINLCSLFFRLGNRLLSSFVCIDKRADVSYPSYFFSEY